MLSLRAGLVIVDQENLRLIYFTTFEYLERHGPDHFPNAQKMIALSCLTYLQFHTFREEERSGEIQPDAKGANNIEVNHPYDGTLAEASTGEKDRPESAEDKLIKSKDWLEHSKEANCKNEGIGEEDENKCCSKGSCDDSINEYEGLKPFSIVFKGTILLNMPLTSGPVMLSTIPIQVSVRRSWIFSVMVTTSRAHSPSF